MEQKWIFDDGAMTRFRNYMEIISPSMEEVQMASFLRKKFQEVRAQVRTDVMGNVYGSFNTDDNLNLGIIAHMDTVAVQVTNILPNGFLQLRHIGLRPHTLLGQPMKVVTRQGIINGVIGFDPTSQYGQPKGLIDEDLWMDIGARDYKHAESMVRVGDLAVLTPRISEIGDDFISGTAIDDRIGLFIIGECMKWFAENPVKVNLNFIGSVQEEVGLRGSSIIASNTKLDACIILDVDYATDTPTPHENQMGKLYMGKGVGLHRKSDINPVLLRLATDIAENEKIAHQISLGRFIYGGTDSTAMQIQQTGIATLNLSIPCRYMHSPIEMLHKKDVESCVQLLIAIINDLSRTKKNSFIPGID